MVQPELVAAAAEHPQRVSVELEVHPGGKTARIRVESYDENLGWYSSGALALPLQQLPLLEQAINDMRSIPREPEYAAIIPFPREASAA